MSSYISTDTEEKKEKKALLISIYHEWMWKNRTLKTSLCGYYCHYSLPIFISVNDTQSTIDNYAAVDLHGLCDLRHHDGQDLAFPLVDNPTFSQEIFEKFEGTYVEGIRPLIQITGTKEKVNVYFSLPPAACQCSHSSLFFINEMHASGPSHTRMHARNK